MDKYGFGDELQQRRTDATRSLSELAMDVGYSKGYLSKIENGRAKPTRELAKKCDALFETSIFTELLAKEIEEDRVARMATNTAAQTPTLAEPDVETINRKFAEFYRLEKNALLAFVRASGVAPDGASVIVQDVMMECYQRWTSIDNPLAWIRGVAKNKMFEHWRREGRRRDELGVGNPLLDAEMAKMTSPSAEAEALSGATLVKLFDQLPHRQKAIMVKWLMGSPPSEIAKELQISESGVRSHVRKARQTLQVAFEQQSAITYQDVGDLKAASKAWENAADYHVRAMRITRAIENWSHAAEAYRSLGLWRKAGQLLVTIAENQHLQGKHDEAVKAYQDAIDAFAFNNEHELIASCHTGIAGIQGTLKDLNLQHDAANAARQARREVQANLEKQTRPDAQAAEHRELSEKLRCPRTRLSVRIPKNAPVEER